MLNNPFSPIFGGKPSLFFGRNDILRRFDLAMVEPGSDDRALFFTGTRGSGKTALLEQLSIRAAKRKRRVIDLGPEDTIAQLIHSLAGFDEVTTTISPQVSVSILGMSGGLSAGSVSKGKHIGRETLQSLLLEACQKSRNGILVTVDEVQKVPIDDVSSLCNAFQMVSRKGHDIMLAVAGLPYAHTNIVKHDGCTYLRRASHEELGLFSWDEADGALVSAFAEISGLSVSQESIDSLNTASYGHPYLLQLLGFHLVSYINEHSTRKTYAVQAEDRDEAIPRAILAYEQRALKPLLGELPQTESSYLKAMARHLNEDRLASTSDVADALGKAQQSLSQARARLIDNGIIASPGHGKVMFCIPYLANYVLQGATESSVIAQARKRMV